MRCFDKIRKNCKQPGGKGRIALWCAVLVVCVFFSVLTLKKAENEEKVVDSVVLFEPGEDVFEIAPSGILQKQFIAQGKSAGGMYSFYIQPFVDPGAVGSVAIRLYNHSTGEIMLEMNGDFSQIPVDKSVYREESQLPMDKTVYSEEYQDVSKAVKRWFEIRDDSNYYHLKSGETYRIEIVNQSDSDPLYLLGDRTIQYGKLFLNGEKQSGFLNMAVYRQPLYKPSALLMMMILLSDMTVLLGLALVLFTDVKTETLYLVLAVGFGIVTLFDLTPVYGHDMWFHYDSAYVVSNRMLGIEDVGYMPSVKEPGKISAFYYRRECDDYSQCQYYHYHELSANYSDMKRGLRYPFASAENQELELVESFQGFISDQLYLYIPQAVGFTIGRLMGVGMMPMLQLARILTYGLFAAVVYVSIRSLPFGKRIYLILAMTPTVFVQTVSITRDAMILAMCFFIIAKTLQLAYREEKVKWQEWAVLLAVSVLLAPCKMVYLPVSFFWLLILYRHYIRGKKLHWGKLLTRTAILMVPILCFFVLSNYGTILGLFQAEKESVYGTPGYTFGYLLTHIPETIFLFANTMRTELGFYLNNAIQLWEIKLGSSDSITLLVMVLFVIESCYVCENRKKVNLPERLFFFVVSLGVFVLVSLASMQWTPLDSDVIVWFQGRYLTPVFPLLCMSFINNKTVRISGNSGRFVKACCCMYPAISLMNMYLWTITM